MLLGPVFHAELLTTARRPRYYALRFGYGAILLGFVSSRYRGIVEVYGAGDGSIPTPLAMASFAQGLFQTLNAVQVAAILVLTPALVAGAIAEERQRKTLHYLLASELSGGEIVAGKLAARLLHAMVLLVAGLPVLGLLGLFGGIDPRQVAMATAGAASTAFFLAGLAIFVSAISRRAREAVVRAYVWGLVWLIVPWLFDTLTRGWEDADHVLRRANHWLMDSSPIALGEMGEGSGADYARVAWMIGLQLVYGSAFVGLAIWRLRPTDRAEGSLAPAAAGVRERRATRPIGDDPMLWKECRPHRQGGPLGWVWTLLGLMALAGLGYLVVSAAWPAFVELAEEGYGRGSRIGPRGTLTAVIQVATVAVSFAWSLAVAVAAALGVTTEREDDTWLSLVGTPMGGREILRAKRVGAWLRPRALLLTLLALWAVGTAAGSIHPLGFAALLATSAAVGAFSSSLGTLASLRLRTTARALATTLVVILGLDLGVLFTGTLWNSTLAVDGWFSSPVLFFDACVDYRDVRDILTPDPAQPATPRWAAAWLVGVAAYALGAVALARAADRSFDRAVDRPRRPSRPRAGPAETSRG